MTVSYKYTQSGGEGYSHYEVTAIYNTPNIREQNTIDDIRTAARLLLGEIKIDSGEGLDATGNYRVQIHRNATLFLQNGRIIAVLSYKASNKVLTGNVAVALVEDSMKTLEQLRAILDVFNEPPE
jgi:hypothetical protein